MINSLNNSSDNQSVFSGDILDNSLSSFLGDENTSLGIVSNDAVFSDPFDSEGESLSLIEQLILSERENVNTDTNSNNFTDAPIAFDSFTGTNSDSVQLDISLDSAADSSFAPPISELEFQGGFGDYEGDIIFTLEIEDSEGNVVETYALSGEGQGTLYTDEDYAYLFFSGTDETTEVDIDSQSNIKFGDFVGASLEISTSGSIDGGDVFLNDEDDTEEAGLILKSGLAGVTESETDAYDLVDLGDVELIDINNNGDVVGNFKNSNLREQVFLYSEGELFPLLNDYETSLARAINDLGEIVAVGKIPEDRVFSSLIIENEATVIPLRPSTTSGLDVKDINNSRQTAGIAYYSSENSPLSSGTISAYFASSPSAITSIGVLLEHGDTRAYGINDLGQVVGYDREGGAFLYSNGTATNIPTLPGDIYSQGLAINNRGQIVGTSNSRTFLYSNGITQDIGVSHSASYNERDGIDINNLGQVVVTSSEVQPYLYEDGELTNLNDLLNSEFLPDGLELTKVQGINDNGQIIAQGTVAGENRGYLLNPTFLASQEDHINIANVSTVGDSVLLQGGEINLSGEAITTAGGSVTLDGTTTVNSSTSEFIFDSSVSEEATITGGDITFTETLDSNSAGSQSIRFKAGTGNVTFENNVGGDAPFLDFRVVSAKNVTADEEIIANELIRINATENIAAGDITSNNGKVKLISEQQSITTQNITSGGEVGDNIVLEAITGVTTTNLDAGELGRVKISSGKVNEDDSIIVGDVETENITGRSLKVIGTGSFTATGDITAHDGKVEVITLGDISTKKIESLNKSISLFSSQGEVTVDGELFSADKGISIVAANDISTKKIDSLDGVVGLSSYQGSITIEDDITTVNGGVVIGAKEDISFANITTEVGEVNIGSANGDISASGDISTDTGYVDIKTSGNIALQNVTTSKGYIDIAADRGVSAQSLKTDNRVIALASISSQVAVSGDINTDGSYVDIEAGLEVATNGIETNGGGIDLISYGDFGDTGVLIASESGEIDLFYCRH